MSGELAIIATTNDILEAEFLRTHLEAAGFEVYLADQNIVGAHFFLANAVGGIKLKVAAGDAEAASAFVEDLRNAEIIEEENFKTDTGWGECKMCESRDIKLDKEVIETSKFLLFGLGLPAPKSKRRLICNNCGNFWTEN